MQLSSRRSYTSLILSIWNAWGIIIRSITADIDYPIYDLSLNIMLIFDCLVQFLCRMAFKNDVHSVSSSFTEQDIINMLSRGPSIYIEFFFTFIARAVQKLRLEDRLTLPVTVPVSPSSLRTATRTSSGKGATRSVELPEPDGRPSTVKCAETRQVRGAGS